MAVDTRIGKRQRRRCATLRRAVRRTLMRTPPDRSLRTPIVLVVAACAAICLLAPGASPLVVAAAQQASDADLPGGLQILQVRPGLFFIAGAGGNIGVQVGEDGVVIVDAGSPTSTEAVLAAIKRISPKPIRYVIDTGPDMDHVGGNEV